MNIIIEHNVRDIGGTADFKLSNYQLLSTFPVFLETYVCHILDGLS
jgi:hypothetical protein